MASQKPDHPPWPACHDQRGEREQDDDAQVADGDALRERDPEASPRGRAEPMRRERPRATAGLMILAMIPSLRVEELLVHGRPAAEVLDREQLRPVGKLEPLEHVRGRPAGSRSAPRSSVPAACSRKLYERLRRGRLPMRWSSRRAGSRSAAWPSGSRSRRELPCWLRVDRLVLVREKDVATAGREGVGRIAGAVVLRGDVVLEQLLQVPDRLRLSSCPRAASRRSAAITFQRAPPEVNGFGVTTWTPGLTRSSHVRMCFGLPVPDDERDDRAGDDPVVLVLRSSSARRSCRRRALHVGLEREVDDVGVQAGDRSRAPGRRRRRSDWLNETPCPALVAWNAVISCANAG